MIPSSLDPSTVPSSFAPLSPHASLSIYHSLSLGYVPSGTLISTSSNVVAQSASISGSSSSTTSALSPYGFHLVVDLSNYHIQQGSSSTFPQPFQYIDSILWFFNSPKQQVYQHLQLPLPPLRHE
jgi:hypothetical protein